MRMRNVHSIAPFGEGDVAFLDSIAATIRCAPPWGDDVLVTVRGIPGMLLSDAPDGGHDGAHDAPGGASSGAPGGKPPRSVGAIGALYTMIGSLGLGVLIGWAIDHHYGTSPWWTLGSSCFFLVVGFYHLVRESSR